MKILKHLHNVNEMLLVNVNVKDCIAHSSADDFAKKCCNSIREISPLLSASYSANDFCKFLASASEIVHFFLLLLEVATAGFPFVVAPLLGGIITPRFSAAGPESKSAIKLIRFFAGLSLHTKPTKALCHTQAISYS